MDSEAFGFVMEDGAGAPGQDPHQERHARRGTQAAIIWEIDVAVGIS